MKPPENAKVKAIIWQICAKVKAMFVVICAKVRAIRFRSVLFQWLLKI